MRCPGQDRRYWTEDAVFEAPCPGCGAAVEFFKDEPSTKCPSCGRRFRNPGIDFGCAQWCSVAQQCLGFAPERGVGAGPREGALAGRLIREVRDAFEQDPARIAHSLTVYHYAKELVSKEGGDPRAVLAAALLLGLEGTDTAKHEVGDAAAPKARQILQTIGADEDTIGQACRILGGLQSGGEDEPLETTIVRDAAALARLASPAAGLRPNDLDNVIERQLKTNAAREKARRLLQDPQADERPG